VKPYDDNIVTFRLMLDGYLAAVVRFEEAARSKDSAAAFRPLFEALNWAAALDERLGKHWAPEGEPLAWSWRASLSGAEAMEGLRFVRNRLHHQWAAALTLDGDGRSYTRTYPLVYFEWRWRSVDEIPAGRERTGEREAYAEHLEGRPARATLATLADVFLHASDLLEPRIAESRPADDTADPA
jgi:hypothetical protein